MSERPAIWLDGRPIDALPLPDRGLNFGDGLFETLLLESGRPLHTAVHFERLAQGLNVLALPDCLPLARAHIEHAAQTVCKYGWHWAAMRLTVTRGAGPRGYAPPENPTPRLLIEVSKLDRDCGQISEPANLAVATLRLSSQPLFAEIKHLNRLEQVLAAAEGQAKGADEVLLLDQSERIISVAAGNLFLQLDGELVTPMLFGCGLKGTRRRLIIERWAPALGLCVREAELTFGDLESAQEVFYCNSVQGLRPVARCGDLRWTNNKICRALFKQYVGDSR